MIFATFVIHMVVISVDLYQEAMIDAQFKLVRLKIECRKQDLSERKISKNTKTTNLNFKSNHLIIIFLYATQNVFKNSV